MTVNAHPDCYATNLYLPVIAAPPPGDPQAYYAQLPVVVFALPSNDHDGLRITLTYPSATSITQVAGDPPVAVPFSTVFAVTGGFVTFHTDAKPFQLPDGENLPVSSGSPSTDLGTAVLNIWGSDFQDLDERLAPAAARPVTIIYRGIETVKARQALAKEVSKLSKRTVLASWKAAGGAGSEPDDATLRQLYLDRVMSGDNAVFVKGGTPLGEASTASSGSDTTAEFVLHALAGAGVAVAFTSPAPLLIAVGASHA